MHTSIWQFWIFWLVVHILAHTEYTLHSGAPFLAQDAVVGVKSVDKLLGGHHGESVLQQHRKSLSVFFLPLSGTVRKIYGACILTSTWRAGSRLSTGKSGRPRLDDSWEHSIVASDSSWDTLTHRIQQNITETLKTAKWYSQVKKVGLSFSVYFLFTFLQQCLVLLCTAAPAGPEKKSRWEQL